MANKTFQSSERSSARIQAAMRQKYSWTKLMLGHMYLSMIEYQKYYWFVAFDATIETFIMKVDYLE